MYVALSFRSPLQTFMLKSQSLRTFMDEKPTAHLAELKRFIWDEYEVDTSEMTISRVRKRMQWSKKSGFAQKTRLLNLLILVCKCNEVRLFRFIGDINNSEFG